MKIICVWCLVFLHITLIGASDSDDFDETIANTVPPRPRSRGFNWSFSYGNRSISKQYDYIIVGAGNAGCVLANRLSEDPDVTVLLLEAGKPEIPLITDAPLFVGHLQSTDFNYGYLVEPQPKACLGLKDKRCMYAHGKGVGGSSITNYMIYTRGNKRDYDDWSAAGNPGWSWEEVLPFYKKIEDSNLKDFQDNGFHGTNGPLPVEDCPFRSKIAKAFVKSAKLAGYPRIDLNGGQQIGISYLQQNTLRGWRVTSAKTYLQPVAFRSNLHVLPQSKATQILIDRASNTADGVEFVHNRKTYSVKAQKEVILSAGSFESPKLLMLSGVGPAEHLKEFGIDVIKDLPVGKVMYEHAGVLGPLFTVNDDIDGYMNFEKMSHMVATSEFIAGRGPLTTNGVESILYMKTNLSESDDPNYPDMEVMEAFTSVAFDSSPGLRQSFRLSDETYQAVFGPLVEKRSFQLLMSLLHPRSKGYLKLKSRNPFDYPLLYGNFFDDDHDLETMVAGIEETIRIVMQKPFFKLGVQLHEAKVPGCEEFTFNTRDYWRCYAKHLTTTFNHQVAVCKMGPASDPTTVVDHKLRVHGIRNLRVADTGIIPFPPSGHTSAYSFLIGERAAAFIKEDLI